VEIAGLPDAKDQLYEVCPPVERFENVTDEPWQIDVVSEEKDAVGVLSQGREMPCALLTLP